MSQCLHNNDLCINHGNKFIAPCYLGQPASTSGVLLSVTASSSKTRTPKVCSDRDNLVGSRADSRCAIIAVMVLLYYPKFVTFNQIKQGYFSLTFEKISKISRTASVMLAKLLLWVMLTSLWIKIYIEVKVQHWSCWQNCFHEYAYSLWIKIYIDGKVQHW